MILKVNKSLETTNFLNRLVPHFVHTLSLFKEIKFYSDGEQQTQKQSLFKALYFGMIKKRTEVSIIK